MIHRDAFLNLRRVFDSLDQFGRGYLTSNDFKVALDWYTAEIDQNTVFTALDVECLIRRFNKDKLNGRVTIQDFLEELTLKATLK